MMKIAKLSALRHFNSSTIKHAGRAFLADRKATTAIEFAMIAVPFIGLIGAVFETGFVYFKTAQLQLTTERASRSVLTHTTDPGMTYQQFVNTHVCTWQTTGTVAPGTLGRMFDCSKIMVDIRAPASWGASNLANDFYNAPNGLNTAIAMPCAGCIAVVRIAYPMSAISAILTGGAFTGQTIGVSRAGQIQYSGAWTHMLLGVFAFRVEPA